MNLKKQINKKQIILKSTIYLKWFFSSCFFKILL